MHGLIVQGGDRLALQGHAAGGADKLLVAGGLFGLVSVGRAWAWAGFVIIAREIAISGLRGVAAMDGATAFAKVNHYDAGGGLAKLVDPGSFATTSNDRKIS